MELLNALHIESHGDSTSIGGVGGLVVYVLLLALAWKCWKSKDFILNLCGVVLAAFVVAMALGVWR